MTVLVLDTPELAQKYEVLSDKQFEHGKLLIADLALKKGEKVLDVGSGTGRLTDYVADIVGKTGLVVGVDPLPLRIEIAKQKAQRKNHLQFAIAGAENLSAFADGQFDVVYLNSVFHWLADKPLALKEIYRVLKPNGRLAITAAAQEQPHTLQLLIQDLFRQEPFNRFTTAASHSPQFKLSISDTRDLLNEAGFDVVSSEIKTFVDYFDESHTVIDFSSSSSFGNFLSTLPELIKTQALVTIQLALEEFRTPKGIELARNLIFTHAVKQATH
jgi:ubiquinone/menaquinone biosynthesis C-methylase UbiE